MQPPGVQSAGQRIVASGIAASGTDWLAQYFAGLGADAGGRQLAAIRGLHAAVLDSVLLLAESAFPGAPQGSLTTNASDDVIMEYPDVVFSTEYYGPGQVHLANVYPSTSGSTGSVLGSASYRGNRVKITLSRESVNRVGDRPGLVAMQDTKVEGNEPSAFIDCLTRNLLRNTTVADQNARIAANCGSAFSSYSEHTWPNIDLGQPCGAELRAGGLFQAYFNFSPIAAVVSFVLGPWKTVIRDPGDVGNSPIKAVPTQTKFNDDCRNPVVEASAGGGGVEEISSGEFLAYIPQGQTEIGLSLHANRVNPGLPEANAFRIYLDGYEVAASAQTYENFWEGSFEMEVTLTDELLGLSDNSFATIHIVPEEPSCDDPYAPNYGENEECVYPEDYCWDPDATNYSEYGVCEYEDDGYCWDWDAINYGEYGECEYEDDGYCWDWDAINYGEYGQCEYEPDPCTEWPELCDPCSDWYTGWDECEDPCSDWYYGDLPCEDPCSDWYFGDEPCLDPCSEWYYGGEPCIPPAPSRGVTTVGEGSRPMTTLAAPTSSTGRTVAFRELRAKSARKASAARVIQARKEAVAAQLANGLRVSPVTTLAAPTSSTVRTVSFRELRAKSARKASAARVKQARKEAVAARLAKLVRSYAAGSLGGSVDGGDGRSIQAWKSVHRRDLSPREESYLDRLGAGGTCAPAGPSVRSPSLGCAPCGANSREWHREAHEEGGRAEEGCHRASGNASVTCNAVKTRPTVQGETASGATERASQDHGSRQRGSNPSLVAPPRVGQCTGSVWRRAVQGMTHRAEAELPHAPVLLQAGAFCVGQAGRLSGSKGRGTSDRLFTIPPAAARSRFASSDAVSRPNLMVEQDPGVTDGDKMKGWKGRPH